MFIYTLLLVFRTYDLLHTPASVLPLTFCSRSCFVQLRCKGNRVCFAHMHVIHADQCLEKGAIKMIKQLGLFPLDLIFGPTFSIWFTTSICTCAFPRCMSIFSRYLVFSKLICLYFIVVSQGTACSALHHQN